MQDLDNNMDDLFRKAASEYPLKISSKNWDTVAAGLDNNSAVFANVKNKEKRKKNIFSLLLIVLFFITVVFLVNDYFTTTSKPSGDKLFTSTNITEFASPGSVAGLSKSKVKIVENQTVNKEQTESMAEKKSTPLRSAKKVMSSYLKTKITVSESEEANEQAALPVINKQTIINDNQAIQHNKNSVIFVALPAASAHNNIAKIAAEKVGIAASEKTSTDTKKTIKKNLGFYTGFVFGPSFNQVKNQGLKKPGYTIGLLAGYQFNKRLSFETGAFVEKKYYSSDGKYFDMSKVMSAMPTGMKVISLEGSSSLFEFSAGLSYNFLLHNNHQLYFKAGASTYVLTQEYNKYQAVIDGTAQHINGSYNSTKKYFAAALNLNLGYQKQITRNAAVRIEPYLQIPTKGIGVGALPVTTVGLHIGFIHSL